MYGDMDDTQKALARAVLAAGLSAQGYEVASGTMLVDELEALGGDAQMGEKYYHFGVFGTPGMDEPWSLQLDGHHLAIIWTVHGADIVMTPTFMGIRPIEVESGDYAGLRVLGALEDRGFALMDSLDEAQLGAVLVDDLAPADLSVGPHMDGLFPADQIGLAASELSADQQVLLLDLIAAYAGNLPDPQAEQRMDEIATQLDDTWFAWMGPTDGSSLYYYRISGPTVWIEYDVIGSPDHLHTIWRDPTNDYGEDLLAMHYAMYPHPFARLVRPQSLFDLAKGTR